MIGVLMTLINVQQFEKTVDLVLTGEDLVCFVVKPLREKFRVHDPENRLVNASIKT